MLNRRTFVAIATMASLAGCGSKFRRYDGPEVTRIAVFKASRKMYLLHDAKTLKSYRIALGGDPIGDKKVEGDGKTPEGLFRIDRRNADSRFHLSLGIDYPQREDVIRASAGGYAPGGDIFIHGQPNAFFGKATLRHDWTAGCIAVADAEIEELWRITPIGTPVDIRP